MAQVISQIEKILSCFVAFLTVIERGTVETKLKVTFYTLNPIHELIIIFLTQLASGDLCSIFSNALITMHQII